MYPYNPNPKVAEELESRFSYHPPVQGIGQTERYVAIRDQCKDTAYMLCRTCPQSRELSVALTHLDSVVMFANAAIARNEPNAQTAAMLEAQANAPDPNHTTVEEPKP